MGGDIETNPGPVKYPCKICNKPVPRTHRALQCDECDQWVHIKCGDVSPIEYENLGKSSATWICHVCGFANFSTSFGSTESILSTENSFLALSDEETEPANIDSSDHIASDIADNSNSSIDMTSETSSEEPKRKPKFRKLKLLSINCRGLKSKRKQRDLRSVIEQEDPDIICGNESHIDGNYHSSEIFPNNYDIFRNDRDKYGGGVFLGVRSDMLAMEEESLRTDCESVWGKIIFAGKQPLYVGSFYRPTNCDPKPLEELDRAVRKLTGKNSLPNIILCGDFNTPSINWDNNSIIKGQNGPQYGKKLNQTLLDLANDNMLTQVQHEPTQGENILDLVFTTIPDQVKKVNAVSGMADHDAVSAELDTAVKYSRKQPRTVYLYKKGDMEGVKQYLEDFKDTFLDTNPMENQIEDNWNSFKKAIADAMDKFIPKKQLSSWQDVPWMTTTVKRMIRKKKRLWNKSKRSKADKDWESFRNLRKAVKTKMKKLHDEYIGSILDNSLKERPKKFWSYISSMKKEANGIPTLKTDKGPAINSKMKAEALNAQYQSVFTKEDTSTIPDKEESTCPSMPDITFTKEGIEKLLSNLNAAKASGPDNIPIRILKEAAQQIAPVLQVIFTQSYQTGNLPQDWLSANIVAIFKKGNKNTLANYRPVSLTCVTTKLMEHIVFHSIMDDIDSYNLLKHCQHGFRQKHSTESQLIVTMEEIARALDDRSQIDMLILDFSKAFPPFRTRDYFRKLTIMAYGARQRAG